MVLLHGAGGNAATWARVAQAWSGFDLWCPDLPGRGGSPPSAAASAGEAAAWVERLAEAFGWRHPIVVGHSYGGAVALELALRCPERLGGIVLVSSGARLRVAPQILAAVAAATVARPFRLNFAFGSGCPADVVQGYGDAAAATPPAATLADWQACDRFDRLGSLEAVAVPTLVLHGGADRLTPPMHQQRLAEAVPGALRVAIPGVGHMLPWEDPEGCAHAVRAWWTQRGR